jgi:tetratricopeptide (TPR) repeat protein
MSPQFENPYQRCGPYRLVRAIGRGGMGSVYLAERDGEACAPVAVKILRYAGEDGAFHERFLRERQILAALHHPGIARLVDAGYTGEHATPYLAMDYIDGAPIDVYAAKLDLREKLKLFLDVADAVSYAHQNLVVHRDLKPSNILVDGEGRPRLLDFGIAKILEPDCGESQTRDRPLTPEYASPEQARGARQTTATDIYSLGAVLYKLVTGASPHVFGGSSREEMIAAICGREPTPASRLKPGIPRDLDCILAKALRKEPSERYASVEAFADDVRALLEWRPVRARSGGAWYRVRRFARRYRLPVAAVALSVIGLGAGLDIANRERVTAERRFAEVRRLANRLIEMDAEVRDLPGATKTRTQIVSTSLEYLKALAPETRGDKDLALEAGDAYRELARIQGVPIHSNLGQFAEAEKSLIKGNALVDSVLERGPDDRRALLSSALIAHDRMVIASVERRIPQVIELAVQAETQAGRLAKRRDLTAIETRELAHTFGNVAIAYSNAHHFEDCIRTARRGIEIARGEPLARGAQGMAVGALASALRWTGDLDGALDTIRESRKMLEATGKPGVAYRMNQFEALFREGRILGEDAEVSLGRVAEAAPVVQRALEIAEEIAAKDPHDSASRHRAANAAQALGDMLRHTDPARALAFYDRGTVWAREVQNNLNAQRNEASLLAGSSYALRGLGRASEAGKRIDAALEIMRSTKDYPAPQIVAIDSAHTVLRALADQYAGTGHFEKAAEVYRQLLAGAAASNPDPQNDLRNAKYISDDQRALVAILQRLGRDREAADLEARRQDLWRGWEKKIPNNPFVLRQLAPR